MQKFGISQPVLRREDDRLLRGAGRYADDVDLPEQAFAAFARTDIPHGTLKRVDVTRAAVAPGVVAVFTAADLDGAGIGVLPYLPLAGFAMDPPASTPHPVLARERVRYVGEPYAVVVAATREQAIDAAELVEAVIEPLPAVGTVDDALATGAPVLWPSAPGNVALSYRTGDAAAVDAAFARAAHVTRLRLVNNRVVPNPIEPRSVAATWDAATDTYALHAATQGVQYFVRVLCDFVLDVPRERMHVFSGDVGGGFGVKEQPYAEDVALLFAAKRLGRPVKWRGTRREHFLSDNHARDAVIDAALAVDADGRFLAVRTTVCAAMGAYISCHGPYAAIRNTPNGLPQVYGTAAIDATVKLVMTNSAPVGPYRGAGREQAAYLVERLVEETARALGRDPIALRRQNLVPASAMPYRTPAGRLYDSGEFEAVLDKALGLADWAGFDARARRSAEHGRIRGRAVSCFLECVGGVPFETVALRFTEDDAVEIRVATQSQGQSHETTFPQVVAERLGVPYDRVRLVQGDSTLAPPGIGTIASRSMIMAGSAIAHGCDTIIAKGRELAGFLLEAAPADLVFADGAFTVAGTDRGITVLEIARRVRTLAATDALPSDLPDSLDSDGDYTAPDLHFPNGCHVAEVELDRETGRVSVDRYVAVDDVGVVVNPRIVHGQVHGGLAQGLGQTLLEGCVYDDAAQLLTASFMDYAMPRADDMPQLVVDFHPVPSPKNPIGVKGSGEIGVTGSIPTISNAVMDALARAGARTDLTLPLTGEKVWRALVAAGDGAGRPR